MSDTILFFQELDNAEKNAAISLSINGNVQSEIIERDLTILLLKTEIKSLMDRNEVLDGAWTTVNAHREQLTRERDEAKKIILSLEKSLKEFHGMGADFVLLGEQRNQARDEAVALRAENEQLRAALDVKK